MRTKRTPVLIDEETYAVVKGYSDRTGVPIARSVDEAIKFWWEHVGIRKAEILGGHLAVDAGKQDKRNERTHEEEG